MIAGMARKPAKPAAKSSASPTPPPTAPAAPAVDPAVYSSLLVNSLAFYAAERLRGPSEPPYNGRCMIAQHHQEWSDLINQYKKLCLVASRDHGKTARIGTCVLRADGSRTKVEDWHGGYLLALDEEAGDFVVSYAPAKSDHYFEPCVRVRTRTGRTTEVTKVHPFRTIDAWTKAQDLQIGDRIAVPRELPGLGKQRVDRTWLMGVLVGNGCLSNGQTYVSTTDVLLRQALVAEGARFGWGCNTDDPTMIRFRRDTVLPNDWLHSVDLAFKDSYSKRVPDCVFTSTDEDIAEFVSGLADTDCFVNVHGGGSIEFFSVSRDLMVDVQHLLVRLGVVAVLTKKNGTYKGERHVSWRLTIRGDSILTLVEKTNLRGKRRVEFERAAEIQRHKQPAGSVDLIPRKVVDWLTKPMYWYKARGVNVRREYDLTRAKVAALVQLEPDKDVAARLCSVSTPDVLWDEVVEIEDIGVQEVVPITVPGFENYVADDIVQHNSYMLSKAYPLWMAEKFPNEEGLLFCATERQARRTLSNIIKEVETNPKLQHLVPKRKLRWSADAATFSTGFTIFAYGYGTRARGAHARFAVVDDTMNDEIAYSVVLRDRAIDYFYNAITPMVVPGGQTLVVGTPFCWGDIYTALERDPLYYFAKYPAITDGKALWPERYPLALLEQTRISMGNLRFSREFLVTPVSDDAALFPDDLFRGAPVEQPDIRFGKDWRWWNKYGIVSVFMGVDFGFSPTSTGDYTVVFVVGVNKAGDRWVIDIIRDRGMSYGSQQALIVRTATKYKPDLIFVESNQAQRIFGDELKKNTDLPIVNYHTGGEKNSFEEGVPSLRLLLENKKYRIPRGDAPTIELTEQWITEMKSFTMVGGKCVSVGEHDDIAMASWLAEQACRSSQFDFAFGPQEGDEEAYQAMIADMQRADDVEMEFYSIPGSGTRRGGRSLLEDGDEHLEPTDDELIADHHNLSERARAVRNVRKRRDDDPHFLGFSILDIIPKG